MRAITINKESWHYRLLEKVDFYPGGARDFCHYLRKLTGLAILTFLLTVLGTIYAASMGEVFAWVTWMVVNGQLIAPDAFVVPGLVASSIGLVFLAAFAFQMLPDDTREVVEAAWETVHDKVCFKVRFTAEQ